MIAMTVRKAEVTQYVTDRVNLTNVVDERRQGCACSAHAAKPPLQLLPPTHVQAQGQTLEGTE